MKLVLHDIEFILQQILLSEQSSPLYGNGAANLDALRALINPQLPFGLRTVDGSYNNLIPGREDFGSADRNFPMLLNQQFQVADTRPVGFFGPQDPGGTAPTNYASLTGHVFDADPRRISNLIADQTADNPAAVAARTRNGGSGESEEGSLDIPNVAPDEGLSAPFNSWFTIFGQFFDHGLDLVDKHPTDRVFIPLAADDPLVLGADGLAGTSDDLPADQRFMPVARTLNQPGSTEANHIHTNQTTPFVDQNQTYTSNPAHQAFLREYEIVNGSPVSTGRFLDGDSGGLATWADIKEQAAARLGITLNDFDIHNVPTLLTDAYGRLALSGNGRVQFVTTTGLVEAGAPGAPVAVPSNVERTGHAFLDDIAHHANPRSSVDHDHDPSTPNIAQTADTDPGTGDDGNAATYDDEMLNAHFITGDGRGNENIGLTAVHHVFHAEHNRLVAHIQQQVAGTPLEAQFHIDNDVTQPWNGERLFQAARFGTEMQYQHLVFEEFARTIQPQIDVFAGYDVNIDPAITAEFAHVVYRFGHSMLTDTIARGADTDASNDIGLIEAFLNPVAYNASGGDANAAAASIINGMTRQVGNHIDEFIVEGVRNNLVGLPLDLGAVNIARGRDAGVPSLNVARAQFFAATSDSALEPYDSWIDFRDNLKNPESLVNFVAAYGTHADITGATTADGRRAAAQQLYDQYRAGNNSNGALDFFNGAAATTGLNDVDFWIGGLAERTMPFGGMLGSTFNFVFETQMERLQDGDRMYYLSRTAGLNFLFELENNSFSDLVMRNLPGVQHLPGNIFLSPDFMIEANDPSTWNVDDGSVGTVNGQLRYTGGAHVVLGGTAGNDNLRAGDGDDTVYGDGGNDRLEGGAGNDFLIGGAGNDVLVDLFGDDNIKGGEGNDVISTGAGADLAIGGEGADFIIHGSGLAEAFAGEGNDLILGGTATDTVFGGSGDDWMEGGGQADLLQGDNGDPFQESVVIGHDVIIGGGGNDDYDMESGDDIGMTGEGTERIEGMLGFDWAINQGDTTPGTIDLALNRAVFLPPAEDALRDRYDLVEAASGWHMNDTVTGDNRVDLRLLPDATNPNPIQLDGLNNNALNSAGIARVSGLQDIVGAGTTVFTTGNILLGGGGNDTINGLAGDDILDGDAWLRVQLQIGTQRFDSLTALQSAALAGQLDPGTVSIVREILVADGSNGSAAGNDTLDGGLGSDTMRGRAGNDTYVVDVLTDRTIEVAGAGADIHAQAAAEGSDTVVSSITWSLNDANGANIENLTLFEPPVTVPPTPAAIIDGTGNALHNVIRGNSAANTLIGLDGDDQIFGNLGNDNLQGDAGNDRLDGGEGLDTMTGGAGNDSYFVDVAGDITTETLALTGDGSATDGGIDTVNSLVTRTLDPNLDNLTLLGTAATNGTGNDLANIIVGNNNDNVLIGAAGADTLRGGAGNDTYGVDNAGDTTVENANEGTDLVNSTIDWVLAANVENLTLQGTAISGTGNALANVITGNALANIIDGGAGIDQMIGGAGNDTYFADDSLDVVTEANNQGTDLVNATATFSLSRPGLTAVENLTLLGIGNIDGTGNGLANVITGNDGNNVLNGQGGDDALIGGGGNDRLVGGAGNDTMTGGLGDDTYVVAEVGDVIVEAADQGSDTIETNVSYSIAGTTLSIENITLTGAANINATGNDFANVLTGNNGANVLVGGGGNDTLVGGGGVDRLDGGTGADAMSGGTGADVYIVDDVGDTVTETGTGVDSVESSVTFTIGTNVENLTLTGSDNIDGSAGASVNTLTGNAGNNRLDGGAGADTMIGGAGDDVYVVRQHHGGRGRRHRHGRKLRHTHPRRGSREPDTDRHRQHQRHRQRRRQHDHRQCGQQRARRRGRCRHPDRWRRRRYLRRRQRQRRDDRKRQRWHRHRAHIADAHLGHQRREPHAAGQPDGQRHGQHPGQRAHGQHRSQRPLRPRGCRRTARRRRGRSALRWCGHRYPHRWRRRRHPRRWRRQRHHRAG
jgi:Ca2+-binding RTX toxin-like protein